MLSRSRLIPLLHGLLALVIALAACESGDNPVDTNSPEEPSVYAGSASCQTCHESIYADYVGSGHAEQFKRIVGGQPPQYVRASLMDHPVSTPPPGTDWDSIAFVLGGTRSYALFVGTDSRVVSGESARWDLTTGQWTSYLVEGQPGLDCGACHATGYLSGGGADASPSAWELDGIACEACHGPGRAHTMSRLASDITVDRTSEFCNTCHAGEHTWIRQSSAHMTPSDASSGHDAHFGVECLTCHEPHISVLYDWDRAILKDCVDCHSPTL